MFWDITIILIEIIEYDRMHMSFYVIHVCTMEKDLVELQKGRVIIIVTEDTEVGFQLSCLREFK